MRVDDGPCLGTRAIAGGPYKWLSYSQVLQRARHFGSGLLERCHLKPGQASFVGIQAQNSAQVSPSPFLFWISFNPIFPNQDFSFSICTFVLLNHLAQACFCLIFLLHLSRSSDAQYYFCLCSIQVKIKIVISTTAQGIICKIIKLIPPRFPSQRVLTGTKYIN